MQYLGNLQNNRLISACFQGKPFNTSVAQVYVPTTEAEEAGGDWLREDLQALPGLTPEKDTLFITGDWNAKVESQEIFRITGKLGLGVQNEKGQRLTEFVKKTHWP